MGFPAPNNSAVTLYNPFNNAAPPFGNFYNPTSLVIGFCSDGAAVPFSALPGGPIASNPFNWKTGTAWLLDVPLHWTSTCWTGLVTLYVDFANGGQVIAGSLAGRQSNIFSPSSAWPGGYIFQDHPDVVHLGVGVNLFWNGKFLQCGVSFTDWPLTGNRQKRGRTAGDLYPIQNSGGVTSAPSTPQMPWMTVPLLNVSFHFTGTYETPLPNGSEQIWLVEANGGPFGGFNPSVDSPGFYSVFVPFFGPAQIIGGASGFPQQYLGQQQGPGSEYTIRNASATVNGTDYYEVLANNAAPFLLQNNIVGSDGDTLGESPLPSVVTYPVWVGPGSPGLGAGGVSFNTLKTGIQYYPNVSAFRLEYPFLISDVTQFSQMPMSNGYNINVWALGGNPNG